MKFTKMQRIFILVFCALITFLLAKCRYEFSMQASITFTVAVFLVLLLSFHFEKRSDQKDEKLRGELETGKYGDAEEWREQYLAFINEKGFEPVKCATMRRDFYRRYFRPTGVFMIVFAAVVLFLGICFMPELGARLFFGAVSFGLFAYGVYCLSALNVRAFLKRCGSAYPLIEASYLGGKLLTYRKKVADAYCNDGINIGSQYVVIFNRKEIAALKYADLSEVKHRILRTKYYGNDVYTGTIYTHHIDVTVQNPDTGKPKTFTAQLSELQAELACRTLCEYRKKPTMEHETKETNS